MMRHRRFAVLPVLLCCLVALPLAAEEQPPTPAPGLPRLGWGPLDVRQGGDKDLERVELVAALGRAVVLTAPVHWAQVEPQRPGSSETRYSFEATDEAVRYWQLAGFEPVLVITCESPWACVEPKRSAWHAFVDEHFPEAQRATAKREGTGVLPPTDDNHAAWGQFVERLAERYDGDGTADMPLLRRPIAGLQILPRADLPTHWLGSADEYLRLLDAAQAGLRQASKTLRLWHAVVDLRVLGHAPLPDERVFEVRLGKLLPSTPGTAAGVELERAIRFARRTLEMPRLFDVVPHFAGDNLDDDTANLRYLRHLLDAAEGQDVETVLGPGPILKLGAPKSGAGARVSDKELARRHRWWRIARTPGQEEQQQAQAWLDQGAAYDLIRCQCRAFAEGARTVVFDPHRTPIRGESEEAGGQARWHYLARGSRKAEPAGGKAQPAAHALEQFRKHIPVFRSASYSDVGTAGHAVVFQLEGDGPRPHVTVVLPGPQHDWATPPDARTRPRRVALPVPAGRYRVEWCKTDPFAARAEEFDAADGVLLLELGPEPVYILPIDKK
jgi:hypothetical protein